MSIIFIKLFVKIHTEDMVHNRFNWRPGQTRIKLVNNWPWRSAGAPRPIESWRCNIIRRRPSMRITNPSAVSPNDNSELWHIIVDRYISSCIINHRPFITYEILFLYVLPYDSSVILILIKTLILLGYVNNYNSLRVV